MGKASSYRFVYNYAFYTVDIYQVEQLKGIALYLYIYLGKVVVKKPLKLYLMHGYTKEVQRHNRETWYKAEKKKEEVFLKIKQNPEYYRNTIKHLLERKRRVDIDEINAPTSLTETFNPTSEIASLTKEIQTNN